MFKIIYFFLQREKRNLLINKWTIPARLALCLVDLCFYYFAAKAFIPETKAFEGLGQWSLFEFVVIGELVLLLALDSLIIFPQQLRRVINEGVFDGLILTNTPLIKSLALIGMSSFLLTILTAVFQVLCLSLLFNVSYPLESVIKVIFLNLISLPFFVSVGLLSAGLMLIFRRGVGLFGSLISSLGVLSGAYFPLTVFPSQFSTILEKFNPLSLLLTESRLILKNAQGEFNLIVLFLFMMAASCLLYFLSHFIYKTALVRYFQRGEKLLLGQ